MSGALLMDTNIMLLLVVGRWNRSRIHVVRRTAAFSAADYDLLEDQIGRYAPMITIPAVLTEVSNLLGNDLHRHLAPTLQEVGVMLEERVPSKNRVLCDRGFDRLGFADASILLAVDPDTTLLTADVSLYLEACYRGLRTQNFNHLRGLAAN